MMTKATLAFALLVSAGNLAVAQQQQQQDQPGWVFTRFFRVHLRNGNCVDGDLVRRTDKEVVIRLPSGEISFRNDQIEKVEFVKMKSYNDPVILLSKKAPIKEAETSSAKADGRPAALPAATPDLADSAEPPPADISRDLANSVDQAIVTWKKAGTSERADLTDTLVSMGASVAPYLEFLLEKRARTTPMEQVAAALVTLSEERFIDLSSRLLARSEAEVRRAAVQGLARATSTRRMPILLNAMEDSDPTVWQTATDAILKASPNDSDKREIAEQLASRMRTAKNNLPLVLALSRLGGRAAHDAIWDLVTDSNETNRLVGLNGVTQLNDPEDGPRVQALLFDSSLNIRKAACLAVGKMKHAKAVGDLVGLLSDSNEGLQANARWALAQITNAPVGDKTEEWKEWWQSFGSKDEAYKQ